MNNTIDVSCSSHLEDGVSFQDKTRLYVWRIKEPKDIDAYVSETLGATKTLLSKEYQSNGETSDEVFSAGEIHIDIKYQDVVFSHVVKAGLIPKRSLDFANWVLKICDEMRPDLRDFFMDATLRQH